MLIAIIGTGVMGTGIGLTLRRHGHDVRCYNRTRANADELVAAGASWHATPREAAEGASHVLILVWNEEALRAVMDGDAGLVAGAAEGQLFIDMSTQLPATARASAAAFAARGARFLDAPVHGSKAEANAGGLWLMAGGARADWDAAAPVFDLIGATRHHMGPVGSGCIAKLCGNHLVSALVAALGESLALAVKGGIDAQELVTLWGESDFRSPIVEGAGRSMLAHDFTVSFHLRTMVKDTELIRNYSESIGVPVMLSNVVHELNKVSQNRGWGDENATAIFRLFEEMAGIPRAA